jgi:glutaredoxin
MNHTDVCSANNCHWCDRAESLLRARGLDSEEIDISPDRARAQGMIDLPDKPDEDHTNLIKGGIQP